MKFELAATAACPVTRLLAPTLAPVQGRGVSAGVSAALLGKRRPIPQYDSEVLPV